VFWQECRKAGLVLPLAATTILALTCIPSYLAGPLSEQSTVGLLGWILLTPLWLALIIGCGFAKFDFWSAELTMPEFSATRPVPPGQWVIAKLLAGATSVLLTWLIVALTTLFWAIWAADFNALEHLWQQLRWRYSVEERAALLPLAVAATILLTWRWLTNGLAVGLSASKHLFYGANVLLVLALAAGLAGSIWQSESDDHFLHLYDLWPLIRLLPAGLAVLVVAKVTLGAWAWHQVTQQHLLAAKHVRVCLLAWVVLTGVLLALAAVMSPRTDWLRHLLMLGALLLTPLVRPALAMLSLRRNRSP
jgi:hypothetical protein